MNPSFGRAFLFAVASLFASAQSPMPIAGVKEPPEWCGNPKAIVRPPEALKALGEVFPKDPKDPVQIRAFVAKLDDLLRDVPTYSDGYLMRVVFRRMLPEGGDTNSALADIDKSIATRPDMGFDSAYKTLSQHYSIRGRVHYDAGQFKEALDDLEAGLKQNYDDGERLFNSSGIKPDAKATDACSWSLEELNGLEVRFPKDYRVHVFKGLYQMFFGTFDANYYALAFKEFEKAAKLNPRSPLPPYLLGRYWSTKAFWSKEAITSEKARVALRVKAIAAYTSAIRLDPAFAPAYKRRADQLEGLKRFPEAIRDYDRVLKLDPTDMEAMSYRANIKSLAGLHGQAIFDYQQAISQKKSDDTNLNSLNSLYENRGDAYMAIGMFREAIADYSKAIELRFGSMTILLSLQQVRGLYPEYDGVPDDLLVRKIHAIFWPNLNYEDVSQKLLVKNGKWAISLNYIYAKRGDAYLQSFDFRRGVQDFQRIFLGMPAFAPSTNRWRSLEKDKDGEWFLDIQSVEFPVSGSGKGKGRIWIKTVTKKSSLVQSYEIDPSSRRLRLGTSIAYDSNGKSIRRSDTPSSWEAIIPGSRGENWLKGLTSQ